MYESWCYRRYDNENYHNCCSYHLHGDVHANCMHLLLQQLMMLQKTVNKKKKNIILLVAFVVASL